MKKKRKKHHTAKNSLTKRKGELWALRDRLERTKRHQGEKAEKRKKGIISKIAELVRK